MVLWKTTQYIFNGGTTKDYSDNMAEKLDEHIKVTLQARYEIVKERLEEYKECIERIVASWMEYETIDGELLRTVIEEYEKELTFQQRCAKLLLKKYLL